MHSVRSYRYRCSVCLTLGTTRCITFRLMKSIHVCCFKSEHFTILHSTQPGNFLCAYSSTPRSRSSFSSWSAEQEPPAGRGGCEWAFHRTPRARQTRFPPRDWAPGGAGSRAAKDRLLALVSTNSCLCVQWREGLKTRLYRTETRG